MSSDLNLNSISYQNQLRSKPIRENFTDIQNEFNDLRSEVYASIASTASEVTSARDNFSNLSDNLHIRKINPAGVFNTGGRVYAQGTPDNTVRITSGSGICPNGVGVNWTSATSDTIAAVDKPRFIVAVVNSDNSLSLELGSTSDDPILPSLAKTQLPLAIIYQNTAGTVAVTNAYINDARRQGARVYNQYFFHIQDAVDLVNDTLGGNIDIGAGYYYEEIDIRGKSNLTLNFENGARVYRPTDSNYCINSANTASSVTEGIKIIGGSFYGTSKLGNKELLRIEYTDKFILVENIFDGNIAATATYKNAYIDQCDSFKLTRNMFFGTSGEQDMNTYKITSTCTDYITDDLLFLYSILI